jgi:hypothetical protein
MRDQLFGGALLTLAGLLAGSMAHLLFSGPKKRHIPQAIFASVLLGIVSAFIAFWFFQSGLGAVIGAVLVVSSWLGFQRFRQARGEADEGVRAERAEIEWNDESRRRELELERKKAEELEQKKLIELERIKAEERIKLVRIEGEELERRKTEELERIKEEERERAIKQERIEAEELERKKAEELEQKKLIELERKKAGARRIFISYRREGDAAQAGRIADLLGHEFGPDHVFMDVDAIALGVDFVEVINVEVAKCDVLLALIGRNWLEARNEAGERVLDNPDDFVRIEIAAALKRQIPVIPILVDGAKIPPANRLPEELKGLARRNALDLRNASFRADMDKLVQQLKTGKSS